MRNDLPWGSHDMESEFSPLCRTSISLTGNFPFGHFFCAFLFLPSGV